jgi:cell division protein FtsN
MLSLIRGYAHVPLALVTFLLVVVVIAWLLERQIGGVWDPAVWMTAPVRTAVTITPAAAPPSTAAAAEAPVVLEPAVPPGPSVGPTAAVAAVAPEPRAAPAPPATVAPDRYVLETGPFFSAEVDDRLEDQLHQLGYATARFRKQETRRVYRVLVTGFASAREARRAAADLGRGSVVTGDGGPEVLVDRHATLQEAVAAARALRSRGRATRVEEGSGPAVIYHIRYGQFPTEAQAEARSEELAALGVASQVVKIR